MKEPGKERGLAKAVAVVKALRGEGGCPWDRAQTHESLRPFLLEETYETLEVLDSLKGPETYSNLKEELGDVLLQVLLHAEIAGESGHFDIDSLGEALAEKLVRRHPHVFGEQKLSTPDEVLKAWEETKKKEKKKDSCLDGIPPGLPALQRSAKVIEKVSKVGFQWPDLKGPLDKVREELGEFLAEVEKAEGEKPLSPATRARLEGELGDLFFTLSNVAHFLKIAPEDSLRSMLGRFEARFRHVETRAREQGKRLEGMSLAEMDVLWDEAKRAEKARGSH